MVVLVAKDLKGSSPGLWYIIALCTGCSSAPPDAKLIRDALAGADRVEIDIARLEGTLPDRPDCPSTMTLVITDGGQRKQLAESLRFVGEPYSRRPGALSGVPIMGITAFRHDNVTERFSLIGGGSLMVNSYMVTVDGEFFEHILNLVRLNLPPEGERSARPDAGSGRRGTDGTSADR